MSQDYPQRESGRGSRRVPPSRELVAPVTATVGEQQPLETDLQAVVLRSVADRLPWLSTPDVLALRAQLTVDVDEAVPLIDRVRTIVDEILVEVEHWKRGAWG
jgi:hypothetical protein